MGLFTKTVTILAPVQVVVTNPIGGIIVLILTIVFWQEILTVIVVAIAIILIITLIKWFSSISDSYSIGTKIFSYAAIIIIICGSSGYVLEKINGKDTQETEDTSDLNEEKSNSYQNINEEKKESESENNSSSAIGYYLNLSDYNRSAQANNLSSNEFIESKNDGNENFKLTESENLFSDGETYYFNYQSNLYKVDKVIINKSNNKIQEVVFHFVKNEETHDIIVRYDESGNGIREISDTVNQDNGLSDFCKLFIAIPIAVLCLMLVIRGLFRSKKKNTVSVSYNTEKTTVNLNESSNLQIEKSTEDPNNLKTAKNKAQIISKDGFLSIEFDTPISSELVGMIRSFVNTFPKKNTKKIRINGDGKNIRQLDLDEVKLLITYLEKQSLYIKNKRKFQL